MNMKHTLFIFAALALTSAGCGSDIGSGSACVGDSAIDGCGAECPLGDECAGGLYCGDDGTCTADCIAGGDECGDGLVCSSTGQCIDDGSGGGGTDAGGGGTVDAPDCPSIEVRTEPQIPTVQLVIDQSGSMNDDFDGVSRWEAVQTALIDATNGVVPQLQDRVIFGASLYSSINGNNDGGTCPMLAEVAPSMNNFEAISQLLLDNEPTVDTPTAEAISAVAAAFPPADGPRIIVLATDGNPDTCADPDAHDANSQRLSEEAVQGAFATQNLETYVLSVGDDVAVPHLQRLANAGRGVDLDTGTETFYVANNPDELLGAFNEIIRGTRTCTFTLDSIVTDPTAGTVTLNGTELVLDTDWVLTDQTTLDLIGDACQTFLNEDIAELSAEFECGAVIIVD